MKDKQTLVGATLAITTLFATGCGVGFDPYNEVIGLRVLAVRATSPALHPGASTTVEALIHQEDTAPLSFEWSWCPMRGDADDGFQCAVSETQFDELVRSFGYTGGSVSFALGTAPSATLDHYVPTAMLQMLCDQQLVAEGVSIPLFDCSNGFPVSVELWLSDGADEIRTIKEITLLLDDQSIANQNPSIGEFRVAAADQSIDKAQLVAASDVSLPVDFSETYELYMDVPPSAAESYTQAATAPSTTREILALTWFVEAGATEFTRTSFIDGTVGFSNLGHNSWETPHPEENDPGPITFYFVLRDDRGGLDWTSRTVQLSKAP